MEAVRLWAPSPEQIKHSNMQKFMNFVTKRRQKTFKDYETLWQWSIDDLEAFWSDFWDFAKIKASHKGDIILKQGTWRKDEPIFGAEFFPEAKLNFAENLLTRRDHGLALKFYAENKKTYEISWGKLYQLVHKLSMAMRVVGIQKGDVVAGFVPNMPESVVAMLATSAIGAIWTSCSPDFGKLGVLDRFGQTQPKLLFCADGYYYNGKENHSLVKINEWIDELPSVQKLIIFPLLQDQPDLSCLKGVKQVEILSDFIANIDELPEDQAIHFTQTAFNDPLYIMYSSGTTGKT